MKNQRLTREEIYAAQRIITRLRELATLKNSAFAGEETVSVEDVRLYLMWVSMEADKLADIVGNAE